MLKSKSAKTIATLAIAGLSITSIFLFHQSGGPEAGESSNDAGASERETISEYDKIMNKVEDGAAKLIDVRTLEEYESRKIAGAKLLPLQDIESGARPEYDDNTKLYIYCRSGNRSAVAADILKADGYDVIDLGGVEDVVAIGGKIAR